MWKSWGYTTWISSSVGTSDFGLQGYVGGILQQFLLICVGKKISYFMIPAFCPSFAEAQQGLPDTPCSLEWPYFQDSLFWVLWAAKVQNTPQGPLGFSLPWMLWVPFRLVHSARQLCPPCATVGALQICSIHGQMSTWFFVCPALHHCVLCQTPTLVASVCITVMPLWRLSAFMPSNFSHFCFSQYR